jgi:hypothetical protein
VLDLVADPTALTHLVRQGLASRELAVEKYGKLAVSSFRPVVLSKFPWKDPQFVKTLIDTVMSCTREGGIFLSELFMPNQEMEGFLDWIKKLEQEIKLTAPTIRINKRIVMFVK